MSDTLRTIEVNSAKLDALKRAIGRLALTKEHLPELSIAFDQSASLIRKVWAGWAMGGSLDGVDAISNPSSALAASIRIDRRGDFSVFVGTDSDQMRRIQEGVSEFDMKKTHPYGKRSRVSKRGVPYLIVPFRWGTNNGKNKRAHFANTIPIDVSKYIQGRSFKKSRRTDTTHLEANYAGEDIERSEYEWGDRLSYDHDPDDSVARNAQGMVRMSGGSGYFTFRVISVNSPAQSWIRKAKAGQDVVGAVAKTAQPHVDAIITAAAEQAGMQ